MKSLVKSLFIVTFISLWSCTGGEVGTGVSNPPTNPTSDKAAVAAASLFSSDSTASLILAQILDTEKFEHVEGHGPEGSSGSEGDDCTNDPSCTCTFVLEGTDANSSSITDAPFGAPGSYGSLGSPVVLEVDDFCTESDGVTENTGSGPDDFGRFATFELAADIDGSCTSSTGASTIKMKTGSSGVWRNTVAVGDTPAYFPQVYGDFVMEVDGVESAVKCTFFMDQDEAVLFADCSDADGNSISQDTDTSCQFSSGSS